MWVQDTTIAFETEPREIVISPLVPMLLMGGGLLLLVLLAKK